MEMSKKQLEFWSVLCALILGVSVVVMLIDFSIKAAILEESTRLRGVIEDGQRPARADNNGVDSNSNQLNTVHSPVLDKLPSRVAPGNVANGATKSATGPRKRRTNGDGASDNPAV